MRRFTPLNGAVATLLILTACSSDADPTADEPDPGEVTQTPLEEATTDPAVDMPTVDDLAGLWSLDHPLNEAMAGFELFWRFTSDGTILVAFGERFGITETPMFRGSYELSGNTLSLTNTEGDGCETGKPALWAVAVPEDGKLRAEALPNPDGPDCQGDAGEVLSLTRISPQSPAAEVVSVDIADGDGEPVTEKIQLAGIWRLDGTGLLLLMDPDDGTYQLDGAGRIGVDPDDSGTLDVGDDGTLVFSSGPDSRFCDEGEVITWTDIQRTRATQDHAITKEMFVLRPMVSNAACWGLSESTLTWIQIVNVNTSLGR